MLSHESALLKLEIAEVNFDEKIYVASVCHFRHGVVESLECLSSDYGFELQVLACMVA